MRKRRYEQWLSLSQMGAIIGLMIGLVWNILGLFMESAPAWWILALLPLPGGLSWLVARLWPTIYPKLVHRERQNFRLTYDVSAAWDDVGLRQSLLTMIQTGTEAIDVIWARDGHEFGCWILFGGCCPDVFERILEDMVPGGTLEADSAPEVGAGVVMLRWDTALLDRNGAVPEPFELCQMTGIEGVMFRWLSEQTATAAIWGSQAAEVVGLWAKAGQVISDEGESLLYPVFTGDNPWPEMSRFPPSQISPGLSSVSRIQLHTAGLQLNGTEKSHRIVVGQDDQGQEVGFSLPDLAGLKEPVKVFGHAASEVVTVLVQQFIQGGSPVLILDGDGGLSAGLNRLLLREVSGGRVLVCDVDRPAQSGFRLNPFWLPADRTLWPALFSTDWQIWLRMLGVTMGGLGREAYYHTQVAVVMTAALAAERGLTLDAAALSEALETPDFLGKVGSNLVDGEQLLGSDVWHWWLTHGQTTSNFDTHLRLAHLRERLNTLLDLPEYRMLWRKPYLNSLEAIQNGQSLIWRLPDRRRRLRGYVTSQLLAISTLLAAWSEATPLVIILHELVADEAWLASLSASPSTRLIVSGRQVESGELQGTGALLLSRLQRDDAERVQQVLPEIRASDLRRLPDQRLIMCTQSGATTLDLKH